MFTLDLVQLSDGLPTQGGEGVCRGLDVSVTCLKGQLRAVAMGVP